jgi:hypothetical protein
MIRNAEDPFNYEKEEERERLISSTWQMYIPVHSLQHRIWEKLSEINFRFWEESTIQIFADAVCL